MNKESKKSQSPRCKGASIEGSFDDLTDAIGKLKKPVDRVEDKKNKIIEKQRMITLSKRD